MKQTNGTEGLEGHVQPSTQSAAEPPTEVAYAVQAAIAAFAEYVETALQS